MYDHLSVFSCSTAHDFLFLTRLICSLVRWRLSYVFGQYAHLIHSLGLTPRPILFSMSTLTWVSDPRISLMLKCFLFITYECVYVSTPYIMFHRVLSRSRHDTIDWDFILIRIIEYFVVCKATLYDTCTLGPAGLISLSSMVSLSWTRIYHYEHLISFYPRFLVYGTYWSILYRLLQQLDYVSTRTFI